MSSAPANAPAIDAERVIADLRELESRTAGPEGAQRVCWTPGWAKARDLLAELLAEIDLYHEVDQAGNAWAYLPGADEGAPSLAIGSHLDSVPSGGWLDGALGVMAALGVLRAWAGSGALPARGIALVDWADEEGAFGRSLLGSAAVCGTLDPPTLTAARDREGRPASDVLRERGVEPERMTDAAERLERIGDYIELHIEQGPVLAQRGTAAAAVTGCAGLERFRLRFEGAASHAGTTPMDMRSDAGLAAAEAALEVERIAAAAGGVGTVGEVRLDPGALTVIPGEAEISVDIRHPQAAQLASMHSQIRAAAAERAAARGCDLAETPVWSIEPIAFDEAMVERAAECCGEMAGEPLRIASGALHDAAEVARRRPVTMVFAPSTGGISHSPREDTPELDLVTAIEAFGLLASRQLGSI